MRVFFSPFDPPFGKERPVVHVGSEGLSPERSSGILGAGS